jgi:hypothetical protein
MTISDPETREIVTQLAETFSKHAKYVNQVWFATILAAAVVTFPASKDDKYILPFSFGEVDKPVYLPIAFLILFVLIVAYCQGYAKAYDTRVFAHKTLDTLESKAPDVRDHYDFLVVDSIARVWPLVSLLRKHFSFGRCVSKSFYFALKIMTQGILLGLPVAALVSIYWKIIGSGSPKYVLWPATVALFFVVVVTLEMIFAEWRVTTSVFRRLEK